jgi:hypothetical protein
MKQVPAHRHLFLHQLLRTSRETLDELLQAGASLEVSQYFFFLRMRERIRPFIMAAVEKARGNEVERGATPAVTGPIDSICLTVRLLLASSTLSHVLVISPCREIADVTRWSQAK